MGRLLGNRSSLSLQAQVRLSASMRFCDNLKTILVFSACSLPSEKDLRQVHTCFMQIPCYARQADCHFPQFTCRIPSEVALVSHQQTMAHPLHQRCPAAQNWGPSTPGGKLNSPWEVAPIHSPRSLALAREVQRPTMRMAALLPASSWLLMYLIRDVITCAHSHLLEQPVHAHAAK